MKQTSNAQSSFSLELVAMVAVIAISSWHIGHYMSTFDGWIMAAIMGATLGFCNFLCAHNIFKSGSTSRFPSFVGLIFFAITSTWMQYTYFNEDADIGTTLLYGVNLDALALGVWAPAAEILLGWIDAANVKQQGPANRHASAPSPWMGLAQALTRRIEQDVTGGSPAEQLRSAEQQVNAGSVQVNTTSFRSDRQARGVAVQVNGSGPAAGRQPDRETLKLSKAAAMDQVLDLFAAHPHTTYEQVAAAIGRSKTTVANYVREFEQQGKVRVSSREGVQVIPNGSPVRTGGEQQT